MKASELRSITDKAIKDSQDPMRLLSSIFDDLSRYARRGKNDLIFDERCNLPYITLIKQHESFLKDLGYTIEYSVIQSQQQDKSHPDYVPDVQTVKISW